MRKIGLTGWIMMAMVTGVVLGLWVHYNCTVAQKDTFSNGISVFTDIFLRLIKMIIAPLVFSTLVVGIAKLGDVKAVGRIGGKTMLWFITATFVSLFLGLILVNLLQPGSSLNLVIPDASASSGVAT